MSGTPVTQAEQRVLIIYRMYARKGLPAPTLSQLAYDLGRARSTIFEQIGSLVAKGMLDRIFKGGKSRYVLVDVCPTCGYDLTDAAEAHP